MSSISLFIPGNLSKQQNDCSKGIFHMYIYNFNLLIQIKGNLKPVLLALQLAL